MPANGCPRSNDLTSQGDPLLVVDLGESTIEIVEPILVEATDPTEITDPAGLLGE